MMDRLDGVRDFRGSAKKRKRPTMTIAVDIDARHADLDHQRTLAVSPLRSPAEVRMVHQITDAHADTVRAGRKATVDVLDGADDRLMVIVGPCSVHDPAAALDYARRLAAKADELSENLHVVMRVGVTALRLPVACQCLDPITPQYIADLVSYGAIGARTAASQVHRQLSSALSMPVGIKNGTDGDVQVAVDGVRAAAASHVFPG